MASAPAAAPPAAPETVDPRPQRLRTEDATAYAEIDGSLEEWKFTPLDRLTPLMIAPPADGGAALDTTVDAEQDGVCLELLWGADEDGQPVSLTLPDSVPMPVDVLSARAQGGRTTVLRVDKGADVAAPVRLTRSSTAESALFDHLVVQVGEHARATVIVETTGTAQVVGKISVVVGDGASLDLVHLHGWDSGAREATHVAYQVGRDARVKGTQVSLGGSLVRVVETVDYTAPGGEVDLRGLALADDGQHLEHRLFVDHTVPHCKSNVTYKNALQGDDARTVWIGDVFIRAAAVGTDTYEFNRNLLLTPDARADSVPNLEIETGEIVGAGHASATGRFDDEQLFYLQSRGIPADVARRMVVRGFFAEIVESIGVPAVESELMREVERRLGQEHADDDEALAEAGS